MKVFFCITVLSLFVYCNGFPKNEFKRAFVEQLKNVPQKSGVIDLSVPLSLRETGGKIDYFTHVLFWDVTGTITVRATVESTANIQVELDTEDIMNSKIMKIGLNITYANINNVDISGLWPVVKQIVETVVKNMANNKKGEIIDEANKRIADFVKPYEGKTINQILGN